MTPVLKNLEALLRGYLLFRCEGKRYLTYTRAKSAMPSTGPSSFDGWHVFKGWLCFYQRLEAAPNVLPTIITESWQNPEDEWTARPSADLSAL